MNQKRKFIRSFLCSYFAVLIPVLAVSLWAAGNTMDQLRQKTYSSIQTRAERAGDELAELYVRYAGSSAALSVEEALTGDFWTSNAKRYSAIKTIKSVGRYDVTVSALFFYHPRHGIYSTTGYSTEDAYFGATLELGEAALPRARALLSGVQQGVTALENRGNSANGYLLLHFPFYSRVPDASVSVNYLIDYARLGEQLRGISPDCPVYVRLMFSDGSAICFAEENGTLSPCAALSAEETRGNTAIRADIPVMDAALEVLYNPAELYAPVRAGQMTSLCILIVGLLASTGISLLLSVRRIKNLQLLTHAAQGEPVRFARENEYAFIGGLLCNSAREIHSLSANLQQSGDTIHCQTMQMIFSGGVKDRPMANELLQTCGLEWSEEFYFVGGACFDASEAVWAALPSLLRREMACPVEMNGRRGVAFLGELPNQDTGGEKRGETARHFRALLEQAGAEEVSIGMSQAYQELSLVSLAFREAAESLTAEGVVCFETLPGGARPVLQPDQEALSRFSEALRERNLKKAQAAFDQMEAGIRDADCSADNREFLRSCILQSLLSAADGETEENEMLLQGVLRVDVQDASAYAAQVRRLLKQAVQSPARTPDLRRITAYIHASYANPDLSAADVAEFAGVNKAHLGRLFKAGLGKTYIEYLSDLRLEKARELLAGTDLPITEIARRVGYYDHSSFRRKFRAQLGLDVTEYRRQFRNREEEEP